MATSPHRRYWAFAYLLAAAVWLTQLHRLYQPSPDDAALLAHGQAEALADAEVRAADSAHVRRVNPEWDLMRRMYLALSFADLALSDVAHRDAHIATLDLVVDDLLAATRDDDPYRFLLPYALTAPWLGGGRSLFLDGEVALVLAARLLVAPRKDLEAPLHRRIAAIVRAMEASPSLSGESYPDEAWTFCNTTALAALRLDDARTGGDHHDLAQRWIAHAKAHLVDARTGLLISRYRYDGTVLEGPEGSSVFMAAHNLILWDRPFAEAQYAQARRLLTFEVLGFGLAREWPLGGSADVDSGPVIPLLGASPGASGMALLGARAFGDVASARALERSLRFTGAPERSADSESFRAAGPMGNAVVLHAVTQGPLWALAAGRAR
ncbi:MAG: hypothetical protein HOO96_42370 [Polyangiaceae bacterium]|nr:hypothetical protein [Polyangiaceae bacterium]